MSSTAGDNEPQAPQSGPEDAPATANPEVQAAEGEGVSSQTDLATALEAAEAKAAENWERFLRATAEQDNIRKRAERDIDQARKFAVERFAKDLLGVLDSLDLGLQSAAKGEEGAQAEALLEGMRLTLKMFGDTLGRHGIQVMAPQGEPFDPSKHEAMTAVPSAEHAPNTVIEVVQKGYLLNERVLRPAMVVVSQAPPS